MNNIKTKSKQIEKDWYVTAEIYKTIYVEIVYNIRRYNKSKDIFPGMALGTELVNKHANL